MDIDIELLKAIDKILCYGFFGEEFKKYADSQLEVPIDESDAETLQKFHDIISIK